MDDRCSETRIINIQAATTSLQCSSQTGIRGLEGSVSRESVGRGMEIWPRFDFFSSVAAGQNYDPAPEARERWWQGRAMGLRRPLLAGLVASNGSWVSKKMQATCTFCWYSPRDVYECCTSISVGRRSYITSIE